MQARSAQQLAEMQRSNNAYVYGQGTGPGVKSGLQQAPSMPYLVQSAAHEAYSFAPQHARNLPAGQLRHEAEAV